VIVPSLQFLGFAAVAGLFFNLGSAAWWRRGVLLIANFAFFLSFAKNPAAILPFSGFLALGYVAQRTTRNGSAPRAFAALLIVTIAAFLWLKRYSFVPPPRI
jgi:O-antigen ligase